MDQTASHTAQTAALDRWAIFEIAPARPGEPAIRHAVGTLEETGRAQVSTALVVFDPATGCAQATSGIMYSLSMLPGPDFAARYVWAKWKQRNGVKHERDLTRAVFAAMSATFAQNTAELRTRLRPARELLDEWQLVARALGS